MRPTALHAFVLLALSASTLVSAEKPKSKATKPATDAGDAPPVLLSTTGGGPRWKTAQEMAAAAQKGDSQAAYQYAALLEDGSPANQVTKDGDKAREFYALAADAGHAEATFRLGKIYGDGLAGATVDQAKSFGYFKKAAKLGVPEARYNVGANLVSGRGVKRDYVEGLAWLMVAAKQGVGGDAVDQVRTRLARRPKDIAAAEQRAIELEAELTTTHSTSPTPTPSPVPVFRPSPPPAPARIQIDPPALPHLGPGT